MDTATDTVRSNNRRIARNTLLLYIRMFITILIGFYTSRVVLNVLGVVDYGIYNVVGGIVSSLAVLNGSMAGATQRWITFALGKEDENYLKKVFSVAMTSQAIIAGVVLVLVESIGLWYLQEYAVIPEERMTAAFWTFQISVFTMVLGILNVPFNGTVTAHEKMGFYALTSIVDVSLKLLMCLALYLIESDKLIIYAGFHAITAVIVFIWVQIYCRKNFMEVRGKPAWDRILYKKMLGLAFWNTSDNLAYMGYTQGTTLLINLFFGPVMNAAAGLSSQVTGILDRFRINFQIAMNPQIMKAEGAGDRKGMLKLAMQESKYSSALMMIIAIPAIWEIHSILSFWLKEVPPGAEMFCTFILLSFIADHLTYGLNTANQASGKVRKYSLLMYTPKLAILPLALFVLFMWHEAIYVMCVYLIIELIVSVSRLFYMRRTMGLNVSEFVTSAICPLLPLCLVLFVVGYLCVKFVEFPHRFIFTLVVSVLLGAIVFWHFTMSNGERLFAKEFFVKKH